MIRIVRRLLCHGTVRCCQYQDSPLCNSARDPHRSGLRRWYKMQGDESVR